jgi:hypothetical protein
LLSILGINLWCYIDWNQWIFQSVSKYLKKDNGNLMIKMNNSYWLLQHLPLYFV